MSACDRQTDGRMDGHLALCIASCGKNIPILMKFVTCHETLHGKLFIYFQAAGVT